MALVAPPSNDKRRVKVYELRNNDWFDRGTGFCSGQMLNEDPTICVESEEEPEKLLLQARISKDDGYQRQQETLIVWTESGRLDMALSFQEAEGCGSIWEFVNQVQQHHFLPDDALSDDAMESFSDTIMLPNPQLGNLHEIDHMVRQYSATPPGRDKLGKFLLGEDYIMKLLPLVEMAENMQAIGELHRLSSIMKMLILLNDTQIIEYMVSDNAIMGVVAALEYDQEFPNHKANHRQYLKNKSRFKEVVPIENPEIKKKIHATWRLQYLKDVVLARILDDPTFSVLNSLIFYNQVEIVNQIQQNSKFLIELFSIIDNTDTDTAKRKDAVCFIQQCCAIGKNLQQPARASLYTNFIQNGLVAVITFALEAKDPGTRIAGVDILVAMIDHDASMVRTHIHTARREGRLSLTDSLISLLLVEEDLGAKAQAADAIKVLLDPASNMQAQEVIVRGNEQFLAKFRPNGGANAQTESFISDFYDSGAKKLFKPLRDLEKRASVKNFSFHEAALLQYLIEILIFFIRQHVFRSKFFIAGEAISARIGQLLVCSQKHVRLAALKYFRTCLGLQDEFYFGQVTQNHIFSPLLDIVVENGSRDNLLNSACLELFEFVRRECIKPMIAHIVQNYRQRLEEITFVDIFQDMVLKFDQMKKFAKDGNGSLLPTESDGPPLRSEVNGAPPWAPGLQEADTVEEEYFATSDDDEELATSTIKALPSKPRSVSKPLVDYPDDDEETGPGPAPDPLTQSFYEDSRTTPEDALPEHRTPISITSSSPSPTPPERLSEKRRREEDEEDELGKLSLSKRRSSSGSERSPNGFSLVQGEPRKDGDALRRKKSFTNKEEGIKGKKIAISLTVKNPNNAMKELKSNRKVEDKVSSGSARKG